MSGILKRQRVVHDSLVQEARKRACKQSSSSSFAKIERILNGDTTVTNSERLQAWKHYERKIEAVVGKLSDLTTLGGSTMLIHIPPNSMSNPDKYGKDINMFMHMRMMVLGSTPGGFKGLKESLVQLNADFTKQRN
eukprot:7373667-Prymnesium_polylepis.1